MIAVNCNWDLWRGEFATAAPRTLVVVATTGTHVCIISGSVVYATVRKWLLIAVNNSWCGAGIRSDGSVSRDEQVPMVLVVSASRPVQGNR